MKAGIAPKIRFFPERLDDYIVEDNPARDIDVFVDELDLQALGFDGIEPKATGRPGLTLHKYWSSACPKCPIKARCTSGEYRRISRWENEHVLEAMQKRLGRTPQASRLRRQTVEHPFGTLKAWMGATHFMTRSLPRVSTEMSLYVLAYNFKRLIRILGTQRVICAMRT